PGEPIGVIVQRYVPAALKGHLSNERRVAEEYRDALVEFEDSSGAISERRIAFRRWRSGRRADEGALACQSPDDLISVLRQLLGLAAQRTKRVHFEWVWDGRFVHVVQADLSHDHATGTSPESTLHGHPQVAIDSTALRHFAAVRPGDHGAVGKMRNHATYAGFGF